MQNLYQKWIPKKLLKTKIWTFEHFVFNKQKNKNLKKPSFPPVVAVAVSSAQHITTLVTDVFLRSFSLLAVFILYLNYVRGSACVSACVCFYRFLVLTDRRRQWPIFKNIPPNIPPIFDVLLVRSPFKSNY